MGGEERLFWTPAELSRAWSQQKEEKKREAELYVVWKTLSVLDEEGRSNAVVHVREPLGPSRWRGFGLDELLEACGRLERRGFLDRHHVFDDRSAVLVWLADQVVEGDEWMDLLRSVGQELEKWGQ
jgi:hypothetical protein